jgi:hypothetical protein
VPLQEEGITNEAKSINYEPSASKTAHYLSKKAHYHYDENSEPGVNTYLSPKDLMK